MNAHNVRLIGGPRNGETMTMPGHALDAAREIRMWAIDPTMPKTTPPAVMEVAYVLDHDPTNHTGPLRYTYDERPRTYRDGVQ